jgi:hypothetical protein
MSLEISPDLRKNVAARSISNKSLMPMFESSKYKYLFMQKWHVFLYYVQKRRTRFSRVKESMETFLLQF